MLRTVVFVLREEPDRNNLYLNRTLRQREHQAITISVGEANERTPNVLVIFLRSMIASHVKKLEKPLDVNEVSPYIVLVQSKIQTPHFWICFLFIYMI